MNSTFHQKPLAHSELAEFCNQMYLMLHSGISPLEAISLLLEDAQNKAEHELLSLMLSELETTGSFYNAVKEAHVFPSYMLHMTRLGEETGTLDDVMLGLSEHYIREENHNQMLKSAILYPSVMLGMMILIIGLLLTKVMPVFSQVFEQLGQQMTGFSAALLTTGDILSRYSIAVIILVILAAVCLLRFKDKLPFQKKLQESMAACRFADGMAIALKSGLTPEQSLELSKELIEHSGLNLKILSCEKMMNDGELLSKALYESHIFSGTHTRLIRVAEKSGMLDEALSQIASDYEYTIQSRLSHLIAMIEPTLVIILSLIVGVILFSVMLPLLGIMTSL